MSALLAMGAGRGWAAPLFLLAALMCWQRIFDINASAGRSTMSVRGRVLVGTALGLLGFGILIGSGDNEGQPSLESDVQNASALTAQSDAAPADDPVAAKFAAMSPEAKREKVKELIEAEQRMPRGEVEGRLTFWDQLLLLDPGNDDYQRKRDILAKESAELAQFRENPELGAEIVKIRPRREGFGAVMVVDVTIRNRSLSVLKDFALSCVDKGPSGSNVGTNAITLYEIVQPRSTQTFKNVNMGLMHPQTKSTNCVINSAEVA